MRESCQRLQQLLEVAVGCRRGPQYDGKCSFYFNYFSIQLHQTGQTETSDRKLCFQSDSRTFGHLSMSLWNDLADLIFDGVGLAGFKSRANTFLLA